MRVWRFTAGLPVSRTARIRWIEQRIPVDPEYLKENGMVATKLLSCVMTTSILGLTLFATGPALALQSKSDMKTQKSQDKSMTKDGATRESPFACNVAGISAEQRPRYIVLAKKLVGAKKEVRELADGYAFRFDAEAATIQELAEFITYERLCCPFFDFELVVEREGGPAWLRLKGREGVKEFIRLEFGLQ